LFDHVELPVSDLTASAAFYRASLAPLGGERTAGANTMASSAR